MWFEKLTGFKEESSENIRQKLLIEGDTFISTVNQRRFTFGKLDLLSLEQLRESNPLIASYKDQIQLSEVVADVSALHTLPSNAKALFQVASQFNLLEMIGPHITPEQGIDRYENDYTQGPACAIACGAGTIYRNYFVKIDQQVGQTEHKQIDCLALIGKELQNERFNLWTMKNGYALAQQEGLLAINKKLASMNDLQRENLKGKLQIGIQWNTEVTLTEERQKVSQIFCSALPVAYSQVEAIYWESFARIILEATYEATLWAALINLVENGSNLVYLTLVGGGAFGNEEVWIFDSLKKAIDKFKQVPLDLKVVSYGTSNPSLLEFIHQVSTE